MNSQDSPSIIHFQNYVTSKDYASAEDELVKILFFINRHNQLPVNQQWNANISTRHDEAAIAHKTHIYNLLARLITIFLADSEYVMSYKGFGSIALYKTFLHWIFAASDYGNLDHILIELGIIDPQDSSYLNVTTEQDLLKLLSCYTIDSVVELNFFDLHKDFPEPAELTYLGCFYEARAVLATRNEQRLHDLIQYHSIVEYMHLGLTQLEFCVNIWMLCTYINSSDKHQLKRSINRLFERYLATHLRPVTKQRIARHLKSYRKRKRDKQRLIVASEVLTHNHAMYRCFIHLITALTEHFETILFTAENAYDPQIEGHFDRVVSFAGSLDNVDYIVNAMVDFAPDIIFYPSLGMAFWTTVLCNLRLAPVQIMSSGHPASSMSKNIDYLITNDEVKDFVCGATEQTVGFPNRHKTYSRPHFDRDTVGAPNPDKSHIDIAINSKDLKIRSVFIEVCQALVTASSKALVFHFFPNCRGIVVDLMHHILAKVLPNSVVYPSMGYADYIQKLAPCDLSLSTFPFGSSNSNVDAYLLGIPKVIYVGNSLESCTDLVQAKRIKLPGWLITSTLDEYFMSALALIEDRQLRQGVSDQIIANNPEEVFFSAADAEVMDQIFPEIFLNIFKQHKFYPKKKYNRRIISHNVAAMHS